VSAPQVDVRSPVPPRSALYSLGAGLIVAGDGLPFAKVSDLNLLADGGVERLLAEAAGPPRLLAWSGSLGESLFTPSPRTWMSSGRTALSAAIERALPELNRRGVRLLLRTHRHHVLSDHHTALAFLDSQSAKTTRTFGLALDYASMFAATMLPAIEDHLTRIFQAIGPRADLVILGDVGSPAGDEPRPAPFGRGVIPAELLKRLIKSHVSDVIPLAAPETDIPAVSAWLSSPE
jgi:hypothetical protein